MDRPEPYDHLAPDGAAHPDGVYRVVGHDGNDVVLLRVGGVDGRRVNTGELLKIGADELGGFAPAENPDRNRSALARAAASPSTAYWSVRAFLDGLRARPLASLVALAALTAGSLGDSFLPIGEAGLDALVVLGGLGLAAVGSGRL